MCCDRAPRVVCGSECLVYWDKEESYQHGCLLGVKCIIIKKKVKYILCGVGSAGH